MQTIPQKVTDIIAGGLEKKEVRKWPKTVQEILSSILDRSRAHFSNPLVVGYEKPSPETIVKAPIFYLAEVMTTWLAIFPRQEKRILFKISPLPPHPHDSFGGRRAAIACDIFDQRISEVVREELVGYVESCRATVKIGALYILPADTSSQGE